MEGQGIGQHAVKLGTEKSVIGTEAKGRLSLSAKKVNYLKLYYTFACIDSFGIRQSLVGIAR
jgi:hypothetical protein